MTYERFLKIIMTLKNQDERIDNLYQNKVDLIDFVDPYQSVITELIKEVYGEDGYDWFSWFCYDNEYGHKVFDTSIPRYRRNESGEMALIEEKDRIYGAIDKDGKPMCYDFESLYNYLENL